MASSSSDEQRPPTLGALPAELLLKVAIFVRDAKSLQDMRLASRAMSQAATSALQSLYTTIAVMPNRSSMTRFSKLARNPLIAPKVNKILVFFKPPVKTGPQPEATKDIFNPYAPHHVIPQAAFDDIMSTFNDSCFDSSVVEHEFGGLFTMRSTVVESGDFEHVLALGIEEFSALSGVYMFPTINSPPYEPDHLILNLPLSPSFLDPRHRYDNYRHVPAETYLRNEALSSVSESSLGWGSPLDCIGALEHWQINEKTRARRLVLGDITTEIMNGNHWARSLARQPQPLEDILRHVTILVLNLKNEMLTHTTPWQLDEETENPDLRPASHWARFLQSARNLTGLQLLGMSSFVAGFDRILHYVFTTCSWPALSELSIARQGNIKLLPYARDLFGDSSGWQSFRQQDLNTFLLKHKHTLQSLMLANVVGIVERGELPTPWADPDDFEDPAPSLEVLKQSLRLWKAELHKLCISCIPIEQCLLIRAYDDADVEALEDWIVQSEIQALASRLGVEREITHEYSCQADNTGKEPSKKMYDFEYEFGGFVGKDHDPQFKPQLPTHCGLRLEPHDS